MKRSEVTRLVAILVAAYPRSAMSAATVRVYEAELSDLEAASAMRAVRSLIRSSKWLPTVAEIREVAADQSADRNFALQAWGIVCDAASRRGRDWIPRFRDPIAQACVEAMGWRYICRSSSDAADRARFVDMYDRLSAAQHRAKVIALPTATGPRLGGAS